MKKNYFLILAFLSLTFSYGQNCVQVPTSIRANTNTFAGYTFGMQVSVAQTSTLISLDAFTYIESTGGIIALYSDSNDYPDALITKIENLPQSTVGTVVSYPVSSPVILQPGNYWIFLEFTSSANFNYDFVNVETKYIEIFNYGSNILADTFRPGYEVRTDVKIAAGLTLDCTASSSEFDVQKLSIYPNPAQDIIQVQGLTEATNFTIYNALGSKVKQGNVDLNQTINTSELASGVYILNLNDSKNIKFVKK